MNPLVPLPYPQWTGTDIALYSVLNSMEEGSCEGVEPSRAKARIEHIAGEVLHREKVREEEGELTVRITTIFTKEEEDLLKSVVPALEDVLREGIYKFKKDIHDLKITFNRQHEMLKLLSDELPGKEELIQQMYSLRLSITEEEAALRSFIEEARRELI